MPAMRRAALFPLLVPLIDAAHLQKINSEVDEVEELSQGLSEDAWPPRGPLHLPKYVPTIGEWKKHNAALKSKEHWYLHFADTEPSLLNFRATPTKNHYVQTVPRAGVLCNPLCRAAPDPVCAGYKQVEAAVGLDKPLRVAKCLEDYSSGPKPFILVEGAREPLHRWMHRWRSVHKPVRALWAMIQMVLEGQNDVYSADVKLTAKEPVMIDGFHGPKLMTVVPKDNKEGVFCHEAMAGFADQLQRGICGMEPDHAKKEEYVKACLSKVRSRNHMNRLQVLLNFVQHDMKTGDCAPELRDKMIKAGVWSFIEEEAEQKLVEFEDSWTAFKETMEAKNKPMEPYTVDDYSKRPEETRMMENAVAVISPN